MGNASERITSTSSFMLFRVGDAVRDAVEQTVSAYDLRGKDLRVLAFIVDEARSQQQLCQATGLDRSTMVAVIDRLERLGYAERAQDAGDRRRHVVAATTRGTRVLHEAMTRLEQVEGEFLAPLSAAQRRALNTALGVLFATHDPTCVAPRSIDLRQ